jgi:hypothetical protein
MAILSTWFNGKDFQNQRLLGNQSAILDTVKNASRISKTLSINVLQPKRRIKKEKKGKIKKVYRKSVNKF